MAWGRFVTMLLCSSLHTGRRKNLTDVFYSSNWKTCGNWGIFFVCVKRFWVQWIQLLGEQMLNICQMAFRQNFLMFGESMANGSILTFKKVSFSSYKCLCPSRIYIFVILYVYMFCKKQLWRCCIICNTYKTPTFTTYVYIMSIQLKTNPIFLSKYVLQGEE